MPALPEDQYLTALGRILYLMNGLEWLVIEIVRRLDPSADINQLAGMTSHCISEQLKSKVAKSKTLSDVEMTLLQGLANDYASLPETRNDVAHARPGSMPDGLQRLYRWAPSKSSFIGWVDEPFLADLEERATRLEREFDATRKWLPQLPGSSPSNLAEE